MAFLFRGQQIIARTLRSVGRSRSIRLAAAEAGATRSGRRHASAYFPEALKVVATAPNSLLFFSYFSSTVPAEMIKTMSPWQIGRASCREKSVDLGGRRIIKKKKK